MTSRLIEDCIAQEGLEIIPTELYINIPSNTFLIVVDPYAINISDLIHAKPESISIIRVRRPMWGQGNIHNYIHLIGDPKHE